MKKHGSSINIDENIDNLFLLIYSTSDVFNGLISYLYFKILNMTPKEYFNLEDENNFFFKEEIEEENKDFLKYEEFKFSKTINEDIKKVIEYIRNDAINNNILKKMSNYYFIINYDKYDSEYIIKKIYNFYKGEKINEIN